MHPECSQLLHLHPERRYPFGTENDDLKIRPEPAISCELQLQ